jgi:hypothetical protein
VSLRGSLETFALTEVLTMVASTGKSGELQVEGETLTGRVWLDDGQIVAARAGEATDPADAVFRLLCLPSGDFAFEADAVAPEAGVPLAVADVLEAANQRLEEWRQIEAVIPSPDALIRLQRTLGGGDVHLSGAQWEVVVALGDGRSLAELMELLDQDELATGRVVKGLVEGGLALVTDAPRRSARRPAAAAPEREDVLVEDLGDGPSDAEDAAPVAETRTDLVRQLASLNEATYSSAADAEDDGADVAGEDDTHQSAPPVPATATTDETVNRGMLLKFLSSVRS